MEETMWNGESREYRKARRKLLKAEVALRAKSEAVAALRRSLPDGGAPREDYVFAAAPDGKAVRLSQLFARGKPSLLLYNFMFAPGRNPCPMCTSILDGLDGQALHAGQRVNFAVVAKASPAELAAFAAQRGWRNLRLLSSGTNRYNRDYGAEGEDGSQWPMAHVWTKRNGEVRHFWASELFTHKDADWPNHPRHVDTLWPLWNLFDLTPEGRGKDWYPKLAY
jgi:predicted dithiol-disulfide oxidoreductase (DUF899 family)